MHLVNILYYYSYNYYRSLSCMCVHVCIYFFLSLARGAHQLIFPCPRLAVRFLSLFSFNIPSLSSTLWMSHKIVVIVVYLCVCVCACIIFICLFCHFHFHYVRCYEFCINLNSRVCLSLYFALCLFFSFSACLRSRARVCVFMWMNPTYIPSIYLHNNKIAKLKWMYLCICVQSYAQ